MLGSVSKRHGAEETPKGDFEPEEQRGIARVYRPADPHAMNGCTCRGNGRFGSPIEIQDAWLTSIIADLLHLLSRTEVI